MERSTVWSEWMPRFAVIGAGITGITTAYELLDQGVEVTVFDRHTYAAMETSFANGGQLSASNAEVWTNWATVFKGLKWMTRKDAPLLVNPKPSWHKISWMAEFLSNIPKYRENTIETVRLAVAARKVLFEMADREGIDFDVERRGILHFYTHEADLAHARKVNDMLKEGGLDRREVSGQEVAEIEPAIKGEVMGGFFTPSDSSGDIHKFTAELAKACIRRGADLRFGTGVSRLRSENGGVRVSTEVGEESFDGVVVSAGVGSRTFAKQLGDRVNVYPVKGYSITVQLHDDASRAAAPHVSLLDDRAKIVASRLGPDRYRIAGTAEFTGENRDIRDDRIRPLVDWCNRFHPEVSTEHAVPWAGLRPMMPSMMPRIGAGHHPGVFYNTGHGHLGWTLSAATARLIAETIGETYGRGRSVVSDKVSEPVNA